MKKKIFMAINLLAVFITSLCILFKPNKVVDAAGDPNVHYSIVTEKVNEPGVECKTFNPGDSFKVLIYINWSSSITLAQSTIELNLAKYSSTIESGTMHKRPLDKGWTAKAKTLGDPIQLTGKDDWDEPIPVTPDMRDKYDPRLDSWTFMSKSPSYKSKGFFDFSVGNTAKQGLQITGIGGASNYSDGSSAYIQGLMDVSDGEKKLEGLGGDPKRGILLGIVEYKLSQTASGKIEFSSNPSKGETVTKMLSTTEKAGAAAPNGVFDGEDGTDTYTVNIASAADMDDPSLDKIEVLDGSQNIPVSIKSIAAGETCDLGTYPVTNGNVTIKPSVINNGTSVIKDGEHGPTLAGGKLTIKTGETKKIYIETTSASGKHGTYTITFTRAAQTKKILDDISFDFTSPTKASGSKLIFKNVAKSSDTFVPSDTKYELHFPTDTQSISLTPKWDPNAEMTVKYNDTDAIKNSNSAAYTPSDKPTKITIKVYSQDQPTANPTEYVFDIKYDLGVDVALSAQGITASVYDPNDQGNTTEQVPLTEKLGTYSSTKEAAYKQSKVILTVAAKPGQTVYIDGVKGTTRTLDLKQAGLNTFNVKVVSASNNEKTYSVQIVRQNQSTNTTITEITFNDGSINYTGGYQLGSLQSPLDYSVKSIKVKIKLADKNAKVVADGVQKQGDYYVFTITINQRNGQAENFNFTVVPEAGPAHQVEKTITVYRKAPDSDTTIQYDIYKFGTSTKINKDPFIKADDQWKIESGSVTLKIAKEYINDKKTILIAKNLSAGDINNKSKYAAYSVSDGYQVNIGDKVYIMVQPENETLAPKVYSFALFGLSTENEIIYIKAIAFDDNGYSKNKIFTITGSYDFTADPFIVDYQYDNIKFEVDLPTNGSLIQGNKGPVKLNAGDNPFTFQAESEGHTPGHEVLIKVVRNLPELTGLTLQNVKTASAYKGELSKVDPKKYTLTLPKDATEFQLTAMFNEYPDLKCTINGVNAIDSVAATIKFTSGSLSTFDVVLTNGSNVTVKYTVNVIEKDVNNKITQDNVVFTGDNTGKTYSSTFNDPKFSIVDVAYADKKVKVTITTDCEISYTNPKIERINDKEFYLVLSQKNGKPESFKFALTPEAGETATKNYQIDVTRVVPKVSTKVSFKAYAGDPMVEKNITGSGTALDVFLEYGLDQFKLNVINNPLDNQTITYSYDNNFLPGGTYEYDSKTGIIIDTTLYDYVYVKVQAEDTDLKAMVYSFHVTKGQPLSDDCRIKEITLIVNYFDGSAPTKVNLSLDSSNIRPINVKYNVSTIQFSVKTEDPKAKLVTGIGFATENPYTLTEASTTFKLQVVAADGIHKSDVYEYVINKDVASESRQINSIVVNGKNYYDQAKTDAGDFHYDIVIPHTSSLSSVHVLFGTNNPSVSISKGNQTVQLKNNVGKVQDVLVQSQKDKITGSGNDGDTYSVDIYLANDIAEIIDVILYDQNGTNLKFPFEGFVNGANFEVPYYVTGFKVKVVLKDAKYGKATINDGTYENHTSELFTIEAGENHSVAITIQANSELYRISNKALGKISDPFEFNVVRKEGSTDAYLTSLEIRDAKGNLLDLAPSFTAGKTNINPMIAYENVEADINDFSSISIKATACNGATIFDTNGSQRNSGQLYRETVNSGSAIFVEVRSEDGKNIQYYNINITTKGAVDPDNKDISMIEAKDNQNAEWLNKDSQSFDPTQYDGYQISLPYNVDGLRFVVARPESKSTLYIDGEKANSGSRYIAFAEGENRDVEILVEDTQGIRSTPYKIHVTKAEADKRNSLASISVDGNLIENIEQYTNSGNPYKYYVKSSVETVDVEALLPIEIKDLAKISGGVATVTLTNTGIVPNQHIITVTAQNGDQKSYYINIYKDEEVLTNNIQIKDQKMDPEFTTTINKYKVEVLSSVDNVSLIVSLNPNVSSTANITINDQLAQSGIPFKVELPNIGNNTVVIKVTSKSGTIEEFGIDINRKAPAADATLKTLAFYKTDDTEIAMTPSFDPLKNEYSILVDPSVSSFKVSYELNDPRASFRKEITDLTLSNVKNIKEIIVLAENGLTENTYTITIYKASNEAELTNMEALDNHTEKNISDEFVFNKETLAYGPYTVINSVNKVKFVTSLSNVEAKAYINGIENTPNSSFDLIEGSNTFEIVIKSQYHLENPSDPNGKFVTYTFEIIRKPLSHEAALKELGVKAFGDTEKVVLEEVAPNIENVYTFKAADLPANPTSIEITGLATYEGAKVDGLGIKPITDFASGKTTFTYDVTVTAECGEKEHKKTYQIIIIRDDLELNKDTSINEIQVFDNDQTQYITGFDVATTTYEITIPFGPNTYTIKTIYDLVNTANGTKKILIDGLNTTNGQQQFKVPTDYKSKTHTVQAVAADGTKGSIYTININFIKPSSNLGLKITVDNVEIPGFDPEIKIYEIKRPSNVVSVYIDAIAEDTNAKIEGDRGPQTLNYGLNPFTITITAENGINKNTYIINVYRDYPEPKLNVLGVVNERLYNKQEEIVKFDPEVKEYYVIVPYLKDQAEIFAQSAEATDIVRGTGNKNLIVGLNPFTVTVTSLTGKMSAYTIYIKRLPKESSDADITDLGAIGGIEDKPILDQLNKDFIESNKLGKEFGTYNVPNSTAAIDLNVVLRQQTGNNAATMEIFNAGRVLENNKVQLEVGMNNIVIVVTAADKVTKNVIVVNVERKQMQIQVDAEEGMTLTQDKEKNNNEEYENNIISENVENKHYFFDLDLGNKKPSEVDFNSLIKSLDDINNKFLKTNVVSDIRDNTKEVVINVEDGDQTRIIHFAIKRRPLDLEIEEVEGLKPVPNNDANKEEIKDNKLPVNGEAEEHYFFDLELGNENLKDIDFTKFVKSMYQDDRLTEVEILTDIDDKTKEVVVWVGDGYQERMIHFAIKYRPLTFKVETSEVTLTANKDKNGIELTDNIIPGSNEARKDYYFNVELGNKNVKDIDFTSYVKTVNDGDKLIVKVMSELEGENPNEVIVSVSDGRQMRIIHFMVPQSPWANIGNISTMVIGIIAVLILTGILISVNRQKYGRISNKRKA